MVDSYFKLVSRVLKNKILVEAAEELTDETQPSTFNFVTNDWSSRLESDTFFQSCQLPFGKREIVSNSYTFESLNKENALYVTLVGYCRFSKPFDGKIISGPSIIIENSDVLTKITKNMTTDLESQIQISDKFKFNFEECSILSCSICRRTREEFTNRGYSLPKLHQPCIIHTKIFDGEKIYNRFYSLMEAIFPQIFIAIMRLRIYQRYNYNDKSNERIHRVSGNVVDFIAFSEAKLDLNATLVNLGDLSNFETLKEETEKKVEPTKKKKKQLDEPNLDDKLLSTINKEEFEDVTERLFSGLKGNKDDIDFENLSEDVSIGDDISMVKRAKTDNEFKRPRVQEEFYSIDN